MITRCWEVIIKVKGNVWLGQVDLTGQIFLKNNRNLTQSERHSVAAHLSQNGPKKIIGGRSISGANVFLCFVFYFMLGGFGSDQSDLIPLFNPSLYSRYIVLHETLVTVMRLPGDRWQCAPVISPCLHGREIAG